MFSFNHNHISPARNSIRWLLHFERRKNGIAFTKHACFWGTPTTEGELHKTADVPSTLCHLPAPRLVWSWLNALVKNFTLEPLSREPDHRAPSSHSHSLCDLGQVPEPLWVSVFLAYRMWLIMVASPEAENRFKSVSTWKALIIMPGTKYSKYCQSEVTLNSSLS